MRTLTPGCFSKTVGTENKCHGSENIYVLSLAPPKESLSPLVFIVEMTRFTCDSVLLPS